MTKDFIIGVSCGIVLAGLVFTSFIVGCIVSAEMAIGKLENETQLHSKLQVMK